MIKIIKQYRKWNGNGAYERHNKEITDVICSHMDNHLKLTKLYDLIKTLESKPDGRYMIKKQSLKHANRFGYGFDYMTFRKTYFLLTGGIAYSVNDKKHKDIFYTNNKRIAIRLAKLLTGGYNELISIVDRKNSGKETYVLNKAQQRGSYKIIVK